MRIGVERNAARFEQRGLDRQRAGLLERLRHFAGRGLARLDIGLVERIDAERCSGHGGRNLEAEKFLREKLWRTDGDAHHGMSATCQRINELVLRRIQMRGVAQIHEQPMRVVGGRLAERLIGDGNHTLSVFARRFGQQLLRPGAERADRWRGDDGELVVPGNGKNADCQAERDAVIFRGRYLGTAAPRHRAGRFEKDARIVTRGRKRHHAEMREHGIASADIGDAAEDATEAFRLGRFLQLRSGIGDGNKLARGRGARVADALAKK